MITLYGATASRASRVRWMLEELGLQYEQVELAPGSPESKAAPYAGLNPNGRIPTLVDGDLVLWESMAINLYLAEKYGGGLLWPDTVEDRARAYQWSFWGALETEQHLITALFNRPNLPEDKRNADKSRRALEALEKPLKILEEKLEGTTYLLGGKFTVADLNLAALMSWSKIARIDHSTRPNLTRWMETCLSRDAYRRIFPDR